MKVRKILLENYKVLEGEHEFSPAGASFFLVAGNNKGKSTVGKLLYELITQKFPAVLVTDGEKEGYVRVELDNDYVIHAKLTEGAKPKLELITPDGGVVSPKDLFGSWYGQGWDFNIDEFLKAQPKQQRNMLEKIVGIDLSSFVEQEKELELERREANRMVKEQAARVTFFDPALVSKPLLDVKELSDKLMEAKKANQERERLSQKKVSAQYKIADLKKQIEQLENDIADCDMDLAMIEETPADQLIILETQIQNVDIENQKIREAKSMKEETLRLEQYRESAKALDDKIQELRQTRDDIIKMNPLPADGLEFDPDGKGLLLNGLPFDDSQVSTSAKAIAALQIAEAQLGEIRYLHFSAEALDRDNVYRIARWAESKNLQLAIERPLWEGGELKMEIIDQTAI